MIRILALVIALILLAGCEDVALISTPKKSAIPSQNPLAKEAELLFWKTLHQGHYDNINEAMRLLMAAYLMNPNDHQLAAHIAFLHIWKITERHRNKNIEPTIVDEIILAKKYFSDAVALNPSDARYLGFLGDSELVEGQIFHDEREQVRGYFTLKRAIKMWPQFNYFTAGYPMSSLEPNSVHFKEGLEWQWITLDICAGEKVNRSNPDFAPYMKYETRTGMQRACWNSWIAPHNFEGFFLNMGDMLVKAGDWSTAIKIYNNAKLSKTYSSWPYRQVLEKKITLAKENTENFQKEFISPTKSIMFNAGYGCVACHQN